MKKGATNAKCGVRSGGFVARQGPSAFFRPPERECSTAKHTKYAKSKGMTLGGRAPFAYFARFAVKSPSAIFRAAGCPPATSGGTPDATPERGRPKRQRAGALQDASRGSVVIGQRASVSWTAGASA